jgi:hypothetical protein
MMGEVLEKGAAWAISAEVDNFCYRVIADLQRFLKMCLVELAKDYGGKIDVKFVDQRFAVFGLEGVIGVNCSAGLRFDDSAFHIYSDYREVNLIDLLKKRGVVELLNVETGETHLFEMWFMQDRDIKDLVVWFQKKIVHFCALLREIMDSVVQRLTRWNKDYRETEVFLCVNMPEFERRLKKDLEGGS